MKCWRVPTVLGVRSDNRLQTRRAERSEVTGVFVPLVPMPDLIVYSSHSGPPSPAELDLGAKASAQSLVLPFNL